MTRRLTEADLWTTSLHPSTLAPISEGILGAGAEIAKARFIESEDPEQQKVLLWVRQDGSLYLERADAAAARAAGIEGGG